MIVNVSIIIPVYNVEKYLRQCLDSVINQTYKDIEIIVVNDCSPDNSLQIIKEYQQKDDRIVLVDLEKNGGVGLARKEGMKVAKGKYITFVDSDDWVKKDYIEVLYNSIIKYNTDVVFSKFERYDNNSKNIINNKEKINYYNKVICSINDKKNLILSEPKILINLIIKKDFIVANNITFPKEVPGEDVLFILKLIAINSKIIYIKDTVYFYRENRDSSIMTDINKKLNFDYDVLFSFFDKILNVFKQVGTFDIYKKELFVFLFIFFCREVTEKNLTSKQYFDSVDVFKKKFYQNDFSFLKIKNIKNKIRLFVFYFYLKFNINYIKIAHLFKFGNKIFS